MCFMFKCLLITATHSPPWAGDSGNIGEDFTQNSGSLLFILQEASSWFLGRLGAGLSQMECRVGVLC